MKTTILMTALAMGIGAGALADTVAEWKFVESSGKPGTIADLSGNGFNLNVSGVAERMKFENVDSRDALTLKGSHFYVSGGQFNIGCNIPVDKFDPVKGFTFEMFLRTGEDFKRDGTQTLFTNMPIGTKPGFVFSTRYSMLEFFSGKGHPSFSNVPNGGGKGLASDSMTAFQKGEWCHVAAVYDGAKLVLYRDGLMVAESKAEFKLEPGSGNHSIGSFHGGTSNGFTGSIAWAKLSDSALTGEAILKSAQSIAE